MRGVYAAWFGISVVLVGMVYSLETFAAAKKPRPIEKEFTGKRAIEILPIENVQIEMPDQSIHNFGADFEAMLIRTLFGTGKYTIVRPSSIPQPKTQTKEVQELPNYFWNGGVFPAARVKVIVEALTFQTGFRGGRMFYGFDERTKTPFNDGSGKLANEFPLRSESYFGMTFEPKGMAPFDSRSGLDLGDGFDLNFLFAWLSLKYARYESHLHLKIELEFPVSKTREFHLVQVKGKGFFFDLAGGYDQFWGGISLARRDAMEQAVRAALMSSASAIEREIKDLPLTAVVDAVSQERGLIFLGTGLSSEVRAGVLFQSLEIPGITIEVDRSVESGSIGHIRNGNLSQIRPGMVLQQVTENTGVKMASAMIDANDVPASFETLTLPEQNLPERTPVDGKPQLSEQPGFVDYPNAVAKSILEGIFLPYRIWRYFMYDRAYHKFDDWRGSPVRDSDFNSDQVVAILDTGVDYNHPTLHSSLWMNPAPLKDSFGRLDRYGWDFISGDSRPYDDNYHGTQLASAVLSEAPDAKILPLKVFNPWGITNSAALYSAFVYAVDHGAKIILCGWATPIRSQALEMGIVYARNKGVKVVAAAGDFKKVSKTPLYPTDYSKKYDNVIAAPADKSACARRLHVAEPRAEGSYQFSSGISAACVAGKLARE